MILVDSSVWVEHFRRGVGDLRRLLSEGFVLTHAFVIGEIACGSLQNRQQILADLSELPQATHASNAEVLKLVESRSLWGLGIGWIDAHLIASALLSNCGIWTRDARLQRAAKRTEIALL